MTPEQYQEYLRNQILLYEQHENENRMLKEAYQDALDKYKIVDTEGE